MTISEPRRWERNDTVAYLHRRAGEFRRDGRFFEAMAIDDMAREIGDGRHYGEHRRATSGERGLNPDVPT
jgi:hypothetical protein